jgi:hypothetical protein
MDRTCKDLLATNRELSRLIFAAMMPGLTSQEIRILKRRERKARMEKRRLCGVLLVMVRTWVAKHKIPG